MSPLISSFRIAIAAGVLSLFALPAGAAELSKELSTAVTHAGLAAGSPDLKMVQTHLHHVVNCLVGPAGAGFDSGQANPCKDQGTGAIPDAPADKQKLLLTAAALAQGGLAETDLAKAQAAATATQAAIKGAE
ncbi:hypothetical protein [Telmatospirillum siberiense]|uniref:Uncharacterized protein n=1 Tax=Telmatospirillum siberiense TaxID=382514 RepID=A0A2N3Q1F2_9PROT|nr:hypothetical protein [Telmatospirillum siberiense]PKU26485.1 hypothetical protein CWS72_01165 [Telmatospirillum siberiense]